MAHWYHLTKKSSNIKTGPIAVSTTSRDSCSPSCPLFNNGCYAETGPLNLHWRKVSDRSRGFGIEDFVNAIKTLPEGSCFRHNQSGDLPHFNGSINAQALGLIANACGERKLKAWTYTHHDTKHYGNRELIKAAPQMGMTVNVSAHSQAHAVEVYREGMPAVCIVPKDTQVNTWCNDGVKFVVCPAQTKANKTCAECKLCANANRTCVVAFKAHGTQAKKVESTIV